VVRREVVGPYDYYEPFDAASNTGNITKTKGKAQRSGRRDVNMVIETRLAFAKQQSMNAIFSAD
jgi:hypothetical protein